MESVVDHMAFPVLPDELLCLQFLLPRACSAQDQILQVHRMSMVVEKYRENAAWQT